MTMRQAFTELNQRLRAVDEALAHLEWSVVNGQMAAGGENTAGDLYDKVGFLRGTFAEAAAAVRIEPARWSVSETRLVLAECQRLCGQAVAAFYNDLMTPELFDVLNSLMSDQPASEMMVEPAASEAMLGPAGPTNWAGWAYGVRDALDNCASPIYNLNRALLQCWGELADRAELPEVVIHTMSHSNSSGKPLGVEID